MKFIKFLLLVIVGSTLSIQLEAQKLTDLKETTRLNMLEPPSERIRMVLDTDTYNEIDDQFAVVYALLSGDKLDVQAIYAAPFHNNRSESAGDGMEKSYEEILRLLEKLDLPAKDFVYKGSTKFMKDSDGPESSDATSDMIRRAKASSQEDPLYVVAVGAITNVANALLLEPSIADKIVVVWLGGNGHTWPHQREFNYFQDIPASRTIFDSGVPFVQLPCTPVVTHLSTTVPEMEKNLAGRGAIGTYLLQIFKDYHDDHFGWSKVLWDMSAVAYLVNPDWTPSTIVHSPIVTDQFTLSFSDQRHFIRTVYFIHRDPIFRDFFSKLNEKTTK